MPHQLRRIIAINIKNSITRLPSCRIVELDPRGGVLAIGPNGVGKTTFLRLLPVFYGATTSQILRGTGRNSLIRYLLPDESSCVVYEYERESEDDLRCAVMHCHAHNDAPEFRIIRGGFREDIFYDEQGQFARRDEYFTRAMDRGYEVSRMLSLSEYRAVILNERVATKDGVALRQLAAQHSLGPRALTNLEQIAAAMANEKISFRDLQNVVIDRLSDSQGEVGLPEHSRRELKKNRGDVSQWLEAHHHLEQVFKAKPLAEELKGLIGEVRRLQAHLGGLKGVTLTAQRQVATELDTLAGQRKAREKEVQQQTEQLQEAAERLELTIGPLQEDRSEKEARVSACETRSAHFQRIHAEQLAVAQDQEEALKAKKQSLQDQLTTLTTASGDVMTRRREAENDLRQAWNTEVTRINTARRAAGEELAVQLLALDEQEANDLAQLSAAPRLAEIPGKLSAHNQRLGEVKAEIRRPQAGEASQAAVAQAEQVARTAGEHLTTAAQNLLEATNEHHRCAQQTVEAVGEAERLADRARELDAQTDALQAQLQPPTGSLLSVLRATDPRLWDDAAKVLDPALLTRQDLSPQWLPPEGESTPDVVAVGPLVLSVAGLARPDWVDMTDLRGQIAAAQARRQQAVLEAETAQSAAQAAAARRQEAQTRLQAAEAAHGLAKTAKANADQALQRARAVLAEEALASRQEAERELAQLQHAIEQLGAEQSRLQQAHAARRSDLQGMFRGQRQSLRDAAAQAAKRLDAEQKDADARLNDLLEQLEQEMHRELAGRGVDPEQIQALRGLIDDADKRLRSIASNRHEVSAWRKFKADELPHLPLWRRDADEARSRHAQAVEERKATLTALDALAQQTRDAFQRMDERRNALEREKGQLQDLLDGPLARFHVQASVAPQVDWHVTALKSEVDEHHKKLGISTDKLQMKTRALNDVMTSRSDPVEQWVRLREREMPDPKLLHEHELACERAQVLLGWFEPTECGPYVEQLNNDMRGFMALASTFVGDLDNFDLRITSFNRRLQKALGETATFARFGDLSVTVRSGLGQLSYMELLRRIRNVTRSQHSGFMVAIARRQEMPSSDDVELIRQFRDILPVDGRVQVDLNEHVQLECSLVENGIRRTITNQEEFAAVSSNGNTALITAMFLLGFVRMIRGSDSAVRLTWVSDEIGRFDAQNLAAFMQTLADHQIDVISASPSVDPALARQFKRLSYFDTNGAISTIHIDSEEDLHVPA